MLPSKKRVDPDDEDEERYPGDIKYKTDNTATDADMYFRVRSNSERGTTDPVPMRQQLLFGITLL